MAKFTQAEKGTICLIQETEDGKIIQIGITTEQSQMLQLFLASMSSESPLVQMGPEFELILKRTICKKCQSKL